MEQKQGVILIFMEFLLAITTFIESKEYIPTSARSRDSGYSESD